MKKAITMLLATLLALALLAGCGAPAATTPPPATTAPAAATTAPAATTVAADPTPEPPVEKEWIDLEIAWWHRANDPEIWKTDAIAQHITEKFKINFTFPTLDVDIKVAAIAGNLPDVYEMYIGTENFNAFISEGFAKAIPDDMLAKYPTLLKITEQNPTAQRIKQETGSYYFIPRYYKPESVVLSHGIYYRYDWMTELGIANPPRNMDEMYEMLKAFYGKTGTYGYAGGLWQIHFAPWVDIDNWVKDDDGLWKPGYASNKVLEGLKWWNRLYQEGIMASNYDEINSRNEIMAGNAGIYYGNAGQHWNNQIVVAGLEAQDSAWQGKGTDAIKLLEPPAGPDGTRNWPVRPKVYTLMFNDAMSDEDLDRTLEFLEWTLSEEGGNLFTYGFEGVDYLIQDGEIVTTRPRNQSTMDEVPVYEIYPCVNLGLIVASDGNPNITTAKFEQMPDRIVEMDKGFWEMYTPAAMDYNIEINNYSTSLYADFQALGFDFEGALNTLVKSKNLEVDFENYRKDLYEAKGLGAVIDEFNAVYK